MLVTRSEHGKAVMTKILIDIDQEALDRAAAVLRTTTPEDTVNAALRHTVDSHRRLPDPPQARRDVSPDTPHDDDPREEREP
jgi:Arc/MetJ family transcription regulator